MLVCVQEEFTMLSKIKYQIISFTQVISQEPRATCGTNYEVIQVLIMNPDYFEVRSYFIIEVQSWAMAHDDSYECYFYDSEESARKAFALGVAQTLIWSTENLSEPKTVDEVIANLNARPNQFRNQMGYLGIRKYSDMDEESVPFYREAINFELNTPPGMARAVDEGWGGITSH